jgi:hypothetical protein
MLQLKNHTPYQAAIAVFPNEQAVDSLYIMLKATFSIGEHVSVAQEQQPIVMADEYWGEPGQSSLKYASEYHLVKPTTDIVMMGAACAPDKQTVEALDVRVSVGQYHKTIRVFGNRRWITGMMGLDISRPVPFESMPLVYERAFGGIHEPEDEKTPISYEPANPVGVGFLGNRKPKEMKGMPLPNLEDPTQLIKTTTDSPTPAGVGVVAPAWAPRIHYAGTYDEQWSKKRAPYLPDDFDLRFFNSASSGLVCHSYLKGGEPVAMVNMAPEGPLRFNLPMVVLEARVRIAGGTQTPPLNLETVLLEPNEHRCSLLWRAMVTCGKQPLKVEEIHIEQKQLNLN